MEKLPQRKLGKRARRTITRALRSAGVGGPSFGGSTPANPVQVVVNSPISRARTARNRRKRLNKKLRQQGMMMDNQPAMVQLSPANALQNPLVPQAFGVSTSSRTQLARSRFQLARGSRLSAEGLRFIKCAFSAADFDGSGTYGVPDDFGGRSTAVKHRAVASFSFSANTDYYFLIPPTPGAAYYLLTKTAGSPVLYTDVFNVVTYADYGSIFAVTTGAASNFAVSKFRYVSQHFELCPTTNQNNWTGSVLVWKLPCQAGWSNQNGAAVNRLTVSGLSGVNANDADMYSGPFNLGCYAGAFNKGSTDWKFSDVWENQLSLPETVQAGDFGQLAAGGATVNGFDNNFETILVKVSGIGANANNTAILRSWACVEYQFTPGSVMYEMQNNKNLCDELAIKLYRRIVTELPTAVSFLDNANFWTRVLGIIRQISGGLSVLPGPYGLAAGGVNSLATAVEQLVL